MESDGGWANIFVLLYVAPACMIVVFLAVAIVGIWNRTVANRMGLRIQADLSRTPTTADLTSIKTWMNVGEVEQQKHPSTAWAPDLNYSVSLRSAWAPDPRHRDDYVQLVDYDHLMAHSTRHEKGIPLMDLPVRLFRINYDRKNEKSDDGGTASSDSKQG